MAANRIPSLMLRWTKGTGLLFCLCGLIWTVRAQETATPLSPDKAFALGNVKGRIDHMAADILGQRLFVAALGNSTIEVVDLHGGKVVKSQSGFDEPQGILYVPEFKRIFVA